MNCNGMPSEREVWLITAGWSEWQQLNCWEKALSYDCKSAERERSKWKWQMRGGLVRVISHMYTVPTVEVEKGGSGSPTPSSVKRNKLSHPEGRRGKGCIDPPPPPICSPPSPPPGGETRSICTPCYLNASCSPFYLRNSGFQLFYQYAIHQRYTECTDKNKN